MRTLEREFGDDLRVEWRSFLLRPRPAEEGRSLDPEGFFRYASDHLPAYAIPAFLHLLPEMEMTGTFKLKKTDLKLHGYDPDVVAGALYYRDSDGRTYRTLDKGVYDRIQAGELKF